MDKLPPEYIREPRPEPPARTDTMYAPPRAFSVDRNRRLYLDANYYLMHRAAAHPSWIEVTFNADNTISVVIPKKLDYQWEPVESPSGIPISSITIVDRSKKAGKP